MIVILIQTANRSWFFRSSELPAARTSAHRVAGDKTLSGDAHRFGDLREPLRTMAASLRRSLTWDRGLEMAKHKSFTVATNVKSTSVILTVLGSAARTKTRIGCYDSTCLRESDLFRYAQSDLDKVVLRSNQRPRKTLGFETPASRRRASVTMPR